MIIPNIGARTRQREKNQKPFLLCSGPMSYTTHIAMHGDMGGKGWVGDFGLEKELHFIRGTPPGGKKFFGLQD